MLGRISKLYIHNYFSICSLSLQGDKLFFTKSNRHTNPQQNIFIYVHLFSVFLKQDYFNTGTTVLCNKGFKTLKKRGHILPIYPQITDTKIPQSQGKFMRQSIKYKIQCSHFETQSLKVEIIKCCLCCLSSSFFLQNHL